MNIYKKYDFSYDANTFMRNFRKTIEEKGYTTLGSFHSLLKDLGVNSYDTARSYYNLRRVLPIDLFKAICDELNLNATEIMFPNSTEVIQNKYLLDFNDIFQTFVDIFVSYNDELNCLEEGNILEDDSSSYAYKELEYLINKLKQIISKYNYLLQQYHYADLADECLKFVGNISVNLLMDREAKEKLDWVKFREWKEKVVTDNFIKTFYDKYTFVLYEYDCNRLLNIIRKQIPLKLFNELNNIMPENDRIEVIDN